MVRAEAAIAADAFDREELGVAAGDEEQEIGKGETVGQAGGQRVALEMIDRKQRLAGGERDRLGRGQADEDAADEAGAGGRGDRVDVGEAEARLAKRRGDDAVERLDMGARGDLGDDPAEGGMVGDLREHDVGQDAPPTRRRRRSTTAAAVSSQLVSMPRTIIIIPMDRQAQPVSLHRRARPIDWAPFRRWP